MEPDHNPPSLAPDPLPGVGSGPRGVTEPQDLLHHRTSADPPLHPAYEVESIQTACPIPDPDSGQTPASANDNINSSESPALAHGITDSATQPTSHGTNDLESQQMAHNMNALESQRTTHGMNDSDSQPAAHGATESESQQTSHTINDTASIRTAHSLMDSESQRLAHGMTDTDSLQTAHAMNMTDVDSLRHGPRPFDTDSNLTNQLAYDSASNRTINPSSDTDSNYTIHPPYPLHALPSEHPLAGEGVAGGSEGTAPTTSNATDLPHASEDPPPYSPPDPKMAYLIYPPAMAPYSGQPVIACQPSPNSPGFYQSQFMPSPSYPPYAIYMNGSSLGEEPQNLPKDYLVESLLVTIFCCIMSGLIAIMYSYETRAALERGDIRGGERASQKARFLVMFSLMFGVFVCVGWIIYAVIALCV